MRLRLEESPWDLYIAIGYALAVTVICLTTGIENPGALLFLFLAPGYVVLAALFPSDRRIGWIERITLSSGVGIAVVAFLALILGRGPWGVRITSIAVIHALFVMIFGAAAYWRRISLPPDNRLSATLDLSLSWWKEYRTGDKIITFTLALCVIIAVGALAYLITKPPPPRPFTEFYILGPTGNASGYPTTLNVSQPGNVIISVANREAVSTNYTVRIDLVGVRLVYNATSGFNETVEVNRTTLSTMNVTLADGANRSYAYTFSIPSAGLWKVQFLLFKDGEFSSAYRKLYLLIRVT